MKEAIDNPNNPKNKVLISSIILIKDKLITNVEFDDMVNVAKKHSATIVIINTSTIPDSTVFCPIIIPPTSTTMDDSVSFGDLNETI